jgi:hypothetical protein
MSLFGKKNESQMPQGVEGKAEPLISVSVMPQLNARDFTNGNGASFAEGTSTMSSSAVQASVEPRNKKMLIIGGVAFFVLFLVGVSYYYIQDARTITPPVKQPVAPSEPVAPQQPQEPVVIPPEESTSTLPLEPTSTPSLSETIVTSTPVAPLVETTTDPESSLTFLNPREYTLGSDVDGDQLSDREEELFNTISGNPDTDGDTFPDGWEIVNLYNPAAANASKVDANAGVTTLTNQDFVYSFFAPRAFLVDATTPGKMRLTTPTGEFISISVQPNLHSLNIRAWLQEKYGAEADRITLNRFAAKNGAPSWVTADGLMRYMVSNRGVIVIRYELGQSPTVNYRQTMEMMAASFSFEAPTTPLLNAPPAPAPVAASSTAPAAAPAVLP